ncbi:MAG: hypothetical protein PHY90_06845 [Desulfitobacteriaceae bacterium]|nr:hypothetical protein [Desulfitobacteriaceae bacterium]
MPLPLAIILGIALGIVIAEFNIMLLICVVICLPGYYAVKQFIGESKIDGPWIIDWGRFLQMFLIQAAILGALVAFSIADDNLNKFFIVTAFIVYSILSALGWALRKEPVS